MNTFCSPTKLLRYCLLILFFVGQYVIGMSGDEQDGCLPDVLVKKIILEYCDPQERALLKQVNNYLADIANQVDQFQFEQLTQQERDMLWIEYQAHGGIAEKTKKLLQQAGVDEDAVYKQECCIQ